MVGDVLAEALTGHLYPEDLQARLRPFGIGEQVAVLAFRLPDPSAAAALRGTDPRSASGSPSLVAIRAGLLCAVDRRRSGVDPLELARKIRGELAARFGEVRAAASRAAPTHSLRLSLPRGALRARGGAAAQRQRAGGRLLRRPRRLPAAAVAAGRRRAELLLPQRARPDRAGRGRLRRGAGALAGRVHRAQRALGEGRERAASATATRCATASAASSS